MLKHSDHCTHIKNPEDKDILTRRLFDVNMRLFRTSSLYRELVLSCVYLIKWAVEHEKDGYKLPNGWSGANAGIPFNIIAIMRDPKLWHSTEMINPKITKVYGKRIAVKSNCGSLTLDKPITVYRSEFIDLEYYDRHGKNIREKGVDKLAGGFTIQHEVEHNLGILITDALISKRHIHTF